MCVAAAIGRVEILHCEMPGDLHVAAGVAAEMLLLTPGELAADRFLVNVERLVRLVGRFAATDGNGWLRNKTGDATGFLEARGGLLDPAHLAALGPCR